MFFFKQKTAYEMRMSDWSSDVCSSDLAGVGRARRGGHRLAPSPVPRLAPPRPGAIDRRSTVRRPAARAFRAPVRSGRAFRRRRGDRKRVVQGKRVFVSVDSGGRRITKKNKLGLKLKGSITPIHN